MVGSQLEEPLVVVDKQLEELVVVGNQLQRVVEEDIPTRNRLEQYTNTSENSTKNTYSLWLSLIRRRWVSTLCRRVVGKLLRGKGSTVRTTTSCHNLQNNVI